MAHQTFLNDAESVQWLLDTHLAPKWADNVPAFGACILEGNEDCPERLTLYTATEPLITDTPIAVFVYSSEDGRYYTQRQGTR